MAAQDLSWFQNNFNDIKNDIAVLPKLKEIKLALTGLHLSQLRGIASSLELHVLFDSLNSSDKNQIELGCDVLKLLLSSIAPSLIFEQYNSELSRAIKHPEKCVKELILHELLRGDSCEVCRLVSIKTVILEDIFNLINDEDLSVAQCAIQLMTKIGSTDYGCEAIISQPLCAQILSTLNNPQKVLVSLRIYQVLIDIGVKSEGKLRAFESIGMFAGLNSILSSDDILAKLAGVEELSKLVSSEHGYNFLSRELYISILTDELNGPVDNPMSSLVYPGLLKFFGCVCRQHAQDLYRQHPNVFEAIVKAVHSEDDVISATALETVGFIASTTQGKMVLQQISDDKMKNVLYTMRNVISRANVDWKVRVMYALGNLLHIENRSDISLTDHWYNHLGGEELTNCLFTEARTPFPELKLAALHVINRLVALPWGQRHISNIQGAVDFLLDRSTESSMEGLVAKYNIIETLVDSDSAADVFREMDYLRFIEYKKQGPTHAPSVLEVAIEGAE